MENDFKNLKNKNDSLKTFLVCWRCFRFSWNFKLNL
jgi:hypothetical protein